MNGRFRFDLTSEDYRRLLPEKVIIGMKSTETEAHVLLKCLGFVLLYRERLEIEKKLPQDAIQFVPDLVQLDFQLQPVFWGECGDCSVDKLNRLAVKAPEAEIWVIKKCYAEAEQLMQLMQKRGLRTGRYHVVALESDFMEELLGLLKGKNRLHFMAADFEPPALQIEFNGLWFDVPFRYWTH